MKKILIICGFLCATLPVFAQEETAKEKAQKSLEAAKKLSTRQYEQILIGSYFTNSSKIEEGTKQSIYESACGAYDIKALFPTFEDFKQLDNTDPKSDVRTNLRVYLFNIAAANAKKEALTSYYLELLRLVNKLPD